MNEAAGNGRAGRPRDPSNLAARRQTRRALAAMTFEEAECIRGIQQSSGCAPSEAISVHRRCVAELYAALTRHAGRALAVHVERTFQVDDRLYLSLN